MGEFNLSYFWTLVKTPKGNLLRPMIPVTCSYKEELETPFILDSGADFSMMSKEMAETIGIPVDDFKPTPNLVGGVGGETEVIEINILVKFGQRNNIYSEKIPFQIPIREGKLKIPILGREPIFRAFDIGFRMSFDDYLGKFTLKKIERIRHRKK